MNVLSLYQLNFMHALKWFGLGMEGIAAGE